MELNDRNIHELDKNLPLEERAEWNAIYASCRSESIISGIVHGVDFHTFDMKNPKNGKVSKQQLALHWIARVPSQSVTSWQHENLKMTNQTLTQQRRTQIRIHPKTKD